MRASRRDETQRSCAGVSIEGLGVNFPRLGAFCAQGAVIYKGVNVMAIDDCFDRKKIEVFTIKPEIKAMTRKERLKLLNWLFMEEYQSKALLCRDED